MSIQISGPCAPADGSVTAAKINSGNVGDGQVLTADGTGGAAWEAPDWRSFPLSVHAVDVAANITPGDAWLTAEFYAGAGRNPIPGDTLVYQWLSGDPPEIAGEGFSVFILLANGWATQIVLGEL